MANRTFQFLGSGYDSATPATVTVTLDGVTIYSGEVPTVNTPVAPAFNEFVALFTAGELPMEFRGNKPMSITVNSGSVVFGDIKTNYIHFVNSVLYSADELAILQNQAYDIDPVKLDIMQVHANPPFSPEQLAALKDPALTPDEFQILAQQNNASWILYGADKFDGCNVDGDSRANVAINGVAQVKPTPLPANATGDWNWDLSAGDVLTYDLVINIPPAASPIG